VYAAILEHTLNFGVCPYIGVYPSIRECTPTYWGIPVYGNALQNIGVAQYTYRNAFNTSNKSVEIKQTRNHIGITVHRLSTFQTQKPKIIHNFELVQGLKVY
jgi:hypothetical protein